jgi:hypothetical protein
MQSRQIVKVAIKKDLRSLTSDFAFWQSRPYLERLAALEEIRQEYHRWKNDLQPGFQRVYRIIKRLPG